MSEKQLANCPECGDVDRRGFIKTMSASAGALLASGGLGASFAHADAPAAENPRPARPAEELIRELYTGLNDDQRRRVVLPWNNANRTAMVNAPIGGTRLGDVYTPAQQELVGRILRSIASDEDGLRKLTRNGSYDGSRTLQGCGSHIFGDPTNGRQFAWVFSGHHITVRCDGNSDPNAAFGGPIYYGHSPDGYSQRNCFYYQTRSVLSVFDALTEAQRRRAVVTGDSGEGANSIRFRAGDYPGLAAGDLTADQRRLVEQVMRDVLSPFRREDADEVMTIIRQNGGLERIHLAFYRDRDATEGNWHYWRLEGPGFVWNYRVLPHVHTYVNIAARQG
jgi:hypothetical protein